MKETRGHAYEEGKTPLRARTGKNIQKKCRERLKGEGARRRCQERIAEDGKFKGGIVTKNARFKPEGPSLRMGGR